MAFLQLEPLPADRDDRRAAFHFAALVNRLRASSDTPAITPAEMRVDWEAESEPPPESVPATPAEAEQQADAIVAQIRAAFPMGNAT